MPDDIEQLKKALEEAGVEGREYLLGWQRAKADLANYKKDEERRKSEWREYLENDLILQFLPILDNFNRALSELHRKHLSSEAEKGFELIQAQFVDTLKRLGVEPIPALGESFNPEFHEAIEEVPSHEPPGTIIEELTKGYQKNGKVLRPSLVKAAKAST